jgi:hypothetical protein
MENPQGTGADKVWAMGKVEPGWYVARWKWNAQYAADLETQGYTVKRSREKPT